MRFQKKFRVALLGIAMAVIISSAAVVSYAYDGTTDPVISLSYLKLYKQQEIDPQIAELSSQITALNSQITALNTQITALQSQITQLQNAEPDVPDGYEVVEVMLGSKVMAKSPCDIMLRSGTAVAVSPFDSQGLSDYTAGIEVMNGDDIFLNHMMLIPRGGDGRGILITSANAFIMIRGEYTIES